MRAALKLLVDPRAMNSKGVPACELQARNKKQTQLRKNHGH